MRLWCQRSSVSGVTIQPFGESAGERGRDRCEQAPVVIVEFGPVDLSSQHHELVAEHDDLEVFGAPRTHDESGKGDEEAVEDAKHEESGWREKMLVSAHVATFRAAQGFRAPQASRSLPPRWDDAAPGRSRARPGASRRRRVAGPSDRRPALRRPHCANSATLRPRSALRSRSATPAGPGLHVGRVRRYHATSTEMSASRRARCLCYSNPATRRLVSARPGGAERARSRGSRR